MNRIQYTTSIGSSTPVTITVTDDDGPVDLTGAQVIELRLQRGRASEVVNIDLSASVADPTAGVIEHTWAGEIATPGVYYVQLRMTLADGATLRIPRERVNGHLWWRWEFLPEL